jgi:hypothetical protein
MFTTFEIHEDLFRGLRGETGAKIIETDEPSRKLTRQRLLAEEVGKNRHPRKRARILSVKGNEK